MKGKRGSKVGRGVCGGILRGGVIISSCQRKPRGNKMWKFCEKVVN